MIGIWYFTREMRLDVHQHVWTESLVDALRGRRELPFVRSEHGLTVLHMAGEQPYVIDCAAESPTRRAELVTRDGVDRALVALSSPVGIEALPREQAEPLIAAYLDGALVLPAEFGVWAPIALDELDPDDVDRALQRGCVGISLAADAIAGIDLLARAYGLLERLEARDAPLFVHPGSAPWSARREAHLGDPLWWSALTGYVSGMQAAWLAFRAAGRRSHPRLRVIFAMLAGLAPLQLERLEARGGAGVRDADPLAFYDTSSYGPAAIQWMRTVVGEGQLVYGSDRPVVDPVQRGATEASELEALSRNAGLVVPTLETVG